LIQHANFKIIEKFKGFRECFRRLDKDFSGSLNFREFVQGMNEIGFEISLSDYRLLFDQIDFDEAGEIDYFKFCLLDFDKHDLRHQLMRDFQLK
jgi:Ca2+-binding EF-hand superfamily protein